MANYALSVYVKAQAKLLQNFNAPEKRFRTPEVHNLFLRNRLIMMPDYNALKPSVSRVVETNYFLRTSRALGAAISHNHTGAQGDSGTLTPTWTAYTDKFVSTLKEANDKIYTLEELHADKMQNVVANFAEGLDTVASTALFTKLDIIRLKFDGSTLINIKLPVELNECLNKTGNFLYWCFFSLNISNRDKDNKIDCCSCISI